MSSYDIWSTGCVNKHNFYCWAKEKTWQLHQLLLHNEKVAVWSAMPFFRDDTSPFLSRCWRHYSNFSSRLLHQLCCLLVPVLGQCLLTTEGSNGLLQETWLMFPAHVVSQNGDVHWYAIFCDIITCGYFLWVNFKSKVYVSNLRIIAKLKHITEIITAMQRLWCNKYWGICILEYNTVCISIDRFWKGKPYV